MVAPAVTSLSPAAGPVAGGTAVTITGTDLTGATAVAFGGTAATSVVVVNDTTVTCVAPAHVAGSVQVEVTTPGGVSANVAGDDYAYVAVPAVTSLNVTAGPLVGGTAVTITGTALTGATGVTFGGTAATSVVVVNATTVTCVSPAKTAGAVQVAVTTVGGTSADVAGDDFTYRPIPTVSAVSPTVVPDGPGTTVTVTGTGFTGATAVNFGSTPGTGLVVVSDISLTVVSPQVHTGASSIRVVTAGGTSADTSADNFTAGPYVQLDGTTDGKKYFMDVEISPATLKSGALLQRLDTKRYPQVGVENF